MNEKRKQNRAMHSKGFSIVELLIVITVIVILAAITLVTYNALQNGAYDSAVKSDLDNTSGLIESYRVAATNTTHQYPRSSSNLEPLGIKVSKNSYDQTIQNNFVFCVSPSSDNYQHYAIIGMSKSGTTFVWTQDGLDTSGATFAKSDYDDSSALCHLLDDKGISSIDMGRVSAGMLGPGGWQAWAHT